MPDINEVSNARQRSVAVETGGHTYLLTYDPNRFTEEARLAYVADVADKQSIRAVWTLLSTLLTAWDVTVAGEPLDITPVNVAILGPLVAPILLQAVTNDLLALARAAQGERNRMVVSGALARMVDVGANRTPVA